MKDTQLYSQILGIEKPWQVTDVQVSLAKDEVEVTVDHGSGKLMCPKYGKACSGYDKRQRRRRHLDTCQLKTLLMAEVPRVECSEHGVVTVQVPWAEPGSGFTALFEALVIDWLKDASTSAVSEHLRLSWNAVDGIMQRAVKRGLSHREALSPRQISVDETSYRKGHEYVTVVTDQEQSAVLHVAENRQLIKQGDERMKGSKYHWLRNRSNLSRHQQRSFSELRQSSLKTARAWAIKDPASRLWDYRSRTWAEKGWKRLINWMARSRLKPMQTTSKTLRNHLWGILNAVIRKVDNSHAESMNSRIKTLKSRARGFRNRERFRNAMYFHLGGLQLYPEGIRA